MKKVLKISLAILIAILIILYGATIYLKSIVKKELTEEKLQEIINSINSAPPLPKNFKETYSNVYVDVFETNFNFSFLLGLVSKRSYQQCPSRSVANWFVSRCYTRGNYLAFIWLLEDNVSQEKCFEYEASKCDFTQNIIGIEQASLAFYNKPIDSLNIEEQLGMILKLKNPALYNEKRNQDWYDKGIKELKDKIASNRK